MIDNLGRKKLLYFGVTQDNYSIFKKEILMESIKKLCEIKKNKFIRLNKINKLKDGFIIRDKDLNTVVKISIGEFDKCTGFNIYNLNGEFNILMMLLLESYSEYKNYFYIYYNVDYEKYLKEFSNIFGEEKLIDLLIVRNIKEELKLKK